ncbi:MAG: NADH-quinone oxidoreductase subunit NuoF [Syntrophomonadaceae bacterium]|jgi:NADH-quinone oxidoreductase subunit F|nr:NADH-quinone oxidoreductase subunit NuoF [Syntrophomonadaceae bacterium]
MHSLKEMRKQFQSAFNESKNRAKIVIGLGTCGIAAGGEGIWTAVNNYIQSQGLEIDMMSTGCIGMCYAEPLMEVHMPGEPRFIYGNIKAEAAVAILAKHLNEGKPSPEYILAQDPRGYEAAANIVKLNDTAFFNVQVKNVLGRCGIIDPDQIGHYISLNGYEALEKVLTEMTQTQVIQEISKSGLRGRGGGGFPTGRKWEAAYNTPGSKKYVVCNADEGDPGAFMDRSILEGDPHSLLEGMSICGYAIGADEGYIYIRAEYPLAIKRLKKAIDDAEAMGILGHNILGSGFNFKIHISAGAGAFVCGEETALMHSIEGKRGMPRVRPPYPAQSGLWGKPTNINNVETYANVACIIRQGAEWFANMGTNNSKGTKVFALTGKINRTGLAEVPIGISLRDIVFNIGGGVQNHKRYKAVQIGGPSGGCIPENLLDTPVDYDSLLALGAMMGSGGLVVMDEDTCMVDVARYFLHFTQEESCGKCAPCREGTMRMLQILEKICNGKGSPEDLDTLENLCRVVQSTSLCGLGQSAPNPVLATLRYFRTEYEAHIFDKKCPAGVCVDLLDIKIDAAKCKGCMLCIDACPVGAISGERKKPHIIDSEKCIKCQACILKCKFGAISKS